MNHLNTLAIDWGKKKIGLAWKSSQVSLSFPIGYVLNSDFVSDSFEASSQSLGDIVSLIQEKGIGLIRIGIPRGGTRKASRHQQWVCDQIISFAERLKNLIDESIEIEFVDEHFSSVQAGATLGNFRKHVGEDVVSAMKLLES